MSENRTYDSDAVSRILGFSKKRLSNLRCDGAILFTPGRARYPATHDAEYIDYLAQMMSFYPPVAHENDPTFFQLCTLRWQFENVPAHLAGRARKMYHNQVKERCKELVKDGKVCTAHDVVPRIGRRFENLSRWGRTGSAAFITIGKTTYVSRRYASFLVQVFTTWQTIDEAADSSGLDYEAISARIRTGKLNAYLCPDRVYRIRPDVVSTIAAPTVSESGDRLLTVAEMAERLGVDTNRIYRDVRLGNIKSVGSRKDLRIPEPEVNRWEVYFQNLCEKFTWLQPQIMHLGEKPRTLTTQQSARLLGIAPDTMSTWCRIGLAPFFPASFTMNGGEIREFPRLYMLGLRKFAGEGKVPRETAERYLALCKEKNCIV